MIARTSLALGLAFVVASCGGKKPADQADNTETTPEGGSTEPVATGDGGADPVTGDKPAENKPCEGLDIQDLAKVLAQAACEVPNPKPDEKAKDLGEILDVEAF